MSKVCTKCKTSKELDQFNWRNKAKQQKIAWCKPCVKEYDSIRNKTDRYKSTKKQQIADRANANKLFIFMHLTSNPCVDCGNWDFRTLQFDHRDDVTKVNNVSHMIRSHSLKNVMDEIAKCDVRCANCHQIRTAKQFGTWRATQVQDTRLWLKELGVSDEEILRDWPTLYATENWPKQTE